jgi:predicted lipid-binding transport protein (Tim44 family)
LQVLDILLFALVAGFLILRLRSVLGRRDGHRPAQRTDPFTGAPAANEDKVVRLPERGEATVDDAAAAETGPQPSGSLDAGLTQIRIADPAFDPDEFASGGRIAFELILTAFSSGDTAALKPLLSPEVFSNFAQSIRERQEAGDTLETQLVGIKTAEIVEAYMAGRTAHVTLRFFSQQVRVLRNADGEIIEGDPKIITDVVDIWTFARDTRSRDPNWVLVATGTPEPE